MIYPGMPNFDRTVLDGYRWCWNPDEDVRVKDAIMNEKLLEKDKFQFVIAPVYPGITWKAVMTF